MTKHTRMLFALALAMMLVIVGGAAPAMGQGRPVAAGNTPASGFAPAQSCSCHSNFLQEWQRSMHAQALSDPLFKTELIQANNATAGKLGPFCVKCHGPVATMIGQASNPATGSAAAQGITCTFCHQITGPTAPTNNVALLIDPSGIYRAQISNPTAPHPTAFSAFHNSSQLCGSCHNVSHPANGLPVETTYSEWLASPQAKAGVTCQDCHMSGMPGEIGPATGWDAGGGPMRSVFHMTFAGAQVGLGDPVLAETMLQSAATLKMYEPVVLEGAKTSSATVTITNTGAGHDLPTGFTELRQMWLQVTFVAPDGKETVLGKHTYGTVLKDAKGNYPADLWDATGIQSDDRIPPGGSSVNSYKIVFPQGVTAGTIKAQLLYRSVPDSLASQAGVDNPVTVMAEDEQPVYTTGEAQRKANGALLTQATQSPLTPLVIAILGIVLCFAIIIYFVWAGNRSIAKAASRGRAAREQEPGGGTSADASTEAEDEDRQEETE